MPTTCDPLLPACSNLRCVLGLQLTNRQLYTFLSQLVMRASGELAMREQCVPQRHRRDANFTAPSAPRPKNCSRLMAIYNFEDIEQQDNTVFDPSQWIKQGKRAANTPTPGYGLIARGPNIPGFAWFTLGRKGEKISHPSGKRKSTFSTRSLEAHTRRSDLHTPLQPTENGTLATDDDRVPACCSTRRATWTRMPDETGVSAELKSRNLLEDDGFINPLSTPYYVTRPTMILLITYKKNNGTYKLK
ncbi:hypothetical protein GGX14DRAFT_393119 [Mycena pura]|uniref:Uncharacterized protein n=1 Tax=Mycena pura TaxID=153505 RepID=A0AAD6YJ00_9AGAR|nr:hypothetical protein GGX14DRAFT_393119 [Mycena pura]